jgi:proteic killer suppression protein
MIRTFADKGTEAIWHLKRHRLPPDIATRAYDKLTFIHAASQLEFLRNPPGNHLEALTGDRAGQHSIRINQQWRICFQWRDGDAYDVEITDYH